MIRSQRLMRGDGQPFDAVRWGHDAAAARQPAWAAEAVGIGKRRQAAIRHGEPGPYCSGSGSGALSTHQADAASRCAAAVAERGFTELAINCSISVSVMPASIRSAARH